MLFTNGTHNLWVISLGPIHLTAYKEGLKLGILTVLRIMAAVTLGCVLSFSTPMIEIMETLRLCKVPSIIIDLADMMHRYLFIIQETARNMRHAQLSRMGDSASWLQQTRDAGKLACYVLIKSIDRSIKIYNAMLSRGYNEDSIAAEYFTTPIPKLDWYFGIIVAFVLIVLVIINIII
jgi:cobalt/nickel transport system permease protein